MEKQISELSQEELVKLATEQQSTIATKDAELKAVKSELEATVKVNADLTKKVEQLPKVEKSDILSFTNDGKKYVFNYGHTVIGDKKVTAKQIVESKELQEALIASKSGMLSIKK